MAETPTQPDRLWTREDDARLVACYGQASLADLAREFPGRSERAISKHARRLGLRGDREYAVNRDYFYQPTLPACYWAGLLAADGCLRERMQAVQLSLHEQDEAHLHRFVQATGFTGPVRHEGRRRMVKVTVCGVPEWLVDLRRTFNVTPRKTLTLDPPAGLTADQRLAFLAGYVDGDGSVIWTRSRTGRLSFRVSVRSTGAVLEWIKREADRVAPDNPASGRIARVSWFNGYGKYTVAGVRAERLARAVLALDPPVMLRKWPIVLARPAEVPRA